LKKHPVAVGLSVVFSMALGLSSLSSARAQGEPFYKGKTIKILVGTSAGSLYDLWARVIAVHLVKHIPGNPDTFV
jgi:tripartite-type tricarboxylate transporter receptor subunit TctC